MAKVVIDGVVYVPRADISTPTDSQLMECIRELVSVQYFSGQQHKHRAWAWDALNAIAPELAELCADDPGAAWSRVNPEEADDG